MAYTVVIKNDDKTFPVKGLNELLDGRVYNPRTHKYHNPVKSNNDKVCFLAIQKHLKGVHISNPIRCTYKIYVKNKMHDRSNIYSSVEKSFLDALQQAKVIKNDGFDDVYDSVFCTAVDKYNPRIEVLIEYEVKNG